jgi:hypothetical protein
MEIAPFGHASQKGRELKGIFRSYIKGADGTLF